MISYYNLSWTIRSIFSVLLLGAEIGNVWNIIYAYRTKKRKYLWLSAVLFICAYILQEINIYIIELHYAGLDKPINGIAVVSAIHLISFIVAISAATIAMVYFNFWYRRTNLTPNVIKDCADHMETGICYYMDGGQVIFQNREMNRLCIELTGNNLLNGEELYGAVNGETVTLSNGRVIRFDHKIIDFENTKTHELLAFDITEFTEKSNKLVRENEELGKMNKALHEYNQKIDDTVRREEILQAKISIHDEMNRLMLMAVATAENDILEDCLDVLAQWKKIVLLLNNDGEEKADIINSARDLAKMLGIEIVLDEDKCYELSERNQEIFSIAAREAVANASKHASASKLVISIIMNQDMVQIRFENDGIMPDKEAVPRGGLKNLSIIASDCGGSLEMVLSDHFTFVLNLPDNN